MSGSLSVITLSSVIKHKHVIRAVFSTMTPIHAILHDYETARVAQNFQGKSFLLSVTKHESGSRSLQPEYPCLLVIVSGFLGYQARKAFQGVCYDLWKQYALLLNRGATGHQASFIGDINTV